MKYLKKLREIVEGWKNHITDNDEVKPLAENRAKICAGCSLNKNNTCSGRTKAEVVTDFVYNGEPRKQGDVVRGCSCPLTQKTVSPNSQCPRGLWENL